MERIAFAAREDKKIDKRSGVSQRLPISAMENVISNAERRAIHQEEKQVVPRIADVYAAMPAITGKLELEYEGEMKGADTRQPRIDPRRRRARPHDAYFKGLDMQQIVQWFDLGGEIQLADTASAAEALQSLRGIQGLTEKTVKVGVGPRTARRFRFRPLNSFSKACTRTSASAATKSASSPRERSSPSRAKNPLSAKTCRSAGGDRITSRQSSAVSRQQSATLQLTAEDRRLTTALMKRIRYSKYVPDPAGEMSMEDLLSALSDYLLQSGFQNYMFYDMLEGEHTLDDLRRAIEQACSTEICSTRKCRNACARCRWTATLDELIEQLIERMEQEDYISVDQPHDPSQQSSVGGQTGEAAAGASLKSPTRAWTFSASRRCAT